VTVAVAVTDVSATDVAVMMTVLPPCVEVGTEGGAVYTPVVESIVPIPVRVVGNLPYFITSDILLRLFDFAKYFDTIVIMLQREVADRVAAPPGGSDYGLLSATAQLYAKVEKLFTLPPEAFEPAPKVHSTVLRLNVAPQIEKLGVAGDGFIGFLKLSFAQKRKTLWNNLKSRYDEAELRRAMTQARINPSARAETLSLKQSATLFRALRSSPEGS